MLLRSFFGLLSGECPFWELLNKVDARGVFGFPPEGAVSGGGKVPSPSCLPRGRKIEQLTVLGYTMPTLLPYC